MQNQFEIIFDDNSVILKEKLYPIFKLLALLQGKPTTKVQTIQWNEVLEAYIYKRDIFAVDLICLSLKTTTGASLELNEEMKGWKNLVDNLSKVLPNCPAFEEWFMEVAIPAFELNLLKIYPREK